MKVLHFLRPVEAVSPPEPPPPEPQAEEVVAAPPKPLTPQQEPDKGRLYTTVEVRIMASGLSARTARIAGLMARGWSTRAGIDQSIIEIGNTIAEAEALREALCSLR